MAKSYYEIAPVERPLQRNELYMHLYLRQADAGPNRDHQASFCHVNCAEVILNPKVRPNDFGVTAAAAWTISESLDPNAKVVARAEGFHMQTSYSGTSWYASFNIVFEDDSGYCMMVGAFYRDDLQASNAHVHGTGLRGSMLQVMGTTPAEGQWAMCSGTGEFALAHGIIKQKVIQSSPGENVKELHIHAFYTPMNNTVVPGATDGKSWTLGA